MEIISLENNCLIELSLVQKKCINDGHCPSLKGYNDSWTSNIYMSVIVGYNDIRPLMIGNTRH